jgi:hypothetical protein
VILIQTLSEISKAYLSQTAVVKMIKRFRRQREDKPAKNDGSDVIPEQRLSAASSSAPLIPMGSPVLQSSADLHPTTLHYSFLLLAKLLNTAFIYVPAFTLSLRIGLRPSRLFVSVSYFSLLAYLVISLALAHQFLSPTMDMFLSKMNKNLEKICLYLVTICQYGWFTSAFFNAAYVLYNRQYLQNFIYHRCSIITLARSYQRYQVVYLFCALNAFSLSTEPLFSLVSLIQDMQQPTFFPSLDAGIFKLIKLVTIGFCFTGTAIAGSGVILITLMTCLLIVTTTKHLKNLVKKQFSRYIQTVISSHSNHNDELKSLLNTRTKKIIKDFACETLTMDWPAIVGLDQLDEQIDLDHPESGAYAALSIHSDGDQSYASNLSLQQRRSISHEFRSAPNLAHAMRHKNLLGFVGKSHHLVHNMLIQSAQDSSKLTSSKTSSLLFLYKNLIKSMSELKCIIFDYERKFGNFHQFSTVLACLIISIWVTSAVTEIRQVSSTGESTIATTFSQSDDNDSKSRGSPVRSNAYALRIFGGTISFILSNIFVFMTCDCLSDRLVKIKSQLFMMNINLACAMIDARRAQQTAINASNLMATKTRAPRVTIRAHPGALNGKPPPLPPSELSMSLNFSEGPRTSRHGRIYAIEQSEGMLQQQQEQRVSQCPELDQIWSLYDQVDRISARVNFKFTSDTYYSKKCMLLVFGRAVSLILFFIQIIDMYSS